MLSTSTKHTTNHGVAQTALGDRESQGMVTVTYPGVSVTLGEDACTVTVTTTELTVTLALAAAEPPGPVAVMV